MAVPMGKPATSFNAQDRKWVADMLDGGGGSGLPEITETDEGKVLTVDNGEAAWDSLPESNVFTVVMSSNDGGYTLVLDKTWQEIYNAVQSRKLVLIFRFYPAPSNEVSVWYISEMSLEEGTYYLTCTNEAVFKASSANDYPSYAD